MSESGLRGTLTKIDTIENKVQLSKCLIDTDPIDLALSTNREIVSDSINNFREAQTVWSSYDGQMLVFLYLISILHTTDMMHGRYY